MRHCSAAFPRILLPCPLYETFFYLFALPENQVWVYYRGDKEVCFSTPRRVRRLSRGNYRGLRDPFFPIVPIESNSNGQPESNKKNRAVGKRNSAYAAMIAYVIAG